MQPDDQVRIRHLVDAATTAQQFVAGRQQVASQDLAGHSTSLLARVARSGWSTVPKEYGRSWLCSFSSRPDGVHRHARLWRSRGGPHL